MATAIAEKTEAKTEAKPAKYVMPHTIPGDRVVFFTEGNEQMDPQPGIVVEVGACSVSVRVVVCYGTDITKRDVCHRSDPRLNNQNIKMNGSWEFHPDVLTLRDLKARMDAAGF